jgi:hypothetical protein
MRSIYMILAVTLAGCAAPGALQVTPTTDLTAQIKTAVRAEVLSPEITTALSNQFEMVIAPKVLTTIAAKAEADLDVKIDKKVQQAVRDQTVTTGGGWNFNNINLSGGTVAFLAIAAVFIVYFLFRNRASLSELVTRNRTKDAQAPEVARNQTDAIATAVLAKAEPGKAWAAKVATPPVAVSVPPFPGPQTPVPPSGA